MRYVVILTATERALLGAWLDERAFYAGLSIDYRAVYHLDETLLRALYAHAAVALDTADDVSAFRDYLARQYDRAACA
jgi:hypothetical protein